MENLYDLIILGAGPAGLSAGIYGGRAGLKTLLIEKTADGGQAALTDQIENYPGSEDGETGFGLASKMAAQAAKFGCEKTYDVVSALTLQGKTKTLTASKGSYHTKALILATGASPKKIGCPGEEEFTGRGVSYCATCDGALFRDKEVFVVGGGDSAVEEAIFLTRFAKQVTIIHRRDTLRAAHSLVQKTQANEKIRFLWNQTVQKLAGDDLLREIHLQNTQTGEQTVLAAQDGANIGLFVFVGLHPNTALFSDSLRLENGYIKTDENMHTAIPGVFAAGDVRQKNLRQIVTAAADGAIAATSAYHYIENLQD